MGEWGSPSCVILAMCHPHHVLSSSCPHVVIVTGCCCCVLSWHCCCQSIIIIIVFASWWSVDMHCMGMNVKVHKMQNKDQVPQEKP